MACLEPLPSKDSEPTQDVSSDDKLATTRVFEILFPVGTAMGETSEASGSFEFVSLKPFPIPVDDQNG